MQKNHLKQDFETYQKCIRDFKTNPKFSETHIFFTYTVPFYTPLEDVFHKGFQLWGGGGDFFFRFSPCVIFRRERSDDWKYICCSQAMPTLAKGKSGSFTKSCEILLLLKLLVTTTLTPHIFHHFPPHPY